MQIKTFAGYTEYSDFETPADYDLFLKEKETEGFSLVRSARAKGRFSGCRSSSYKHVDGRTISAKKYDWGGTVNVWNKNNGKDQS